MARMTVQMQVSCTVRPADQDTASFVSHCPELQLYSAGNTELEAIEAMRSAITLFLQWAYENEKLGEILLKLGMEFVAAPEPVQWRSPIAGPPDVKVGSVGSQSIPIQVPFYLLEQAQHAAC